MNPENRRLLIVDDEAGIRRSLKIGLSQRGYTAEGIEEGLPALKLIASAYDESRPYSLVILDINLPDINGLRLLDVIRSRFPGLPVVVISAYGTAATDGTVSARHGDAYLEKPFALDDLEAVIDRLPHRELGPVESPTPALSPKTVSGYALIRAREGSDVVALFRKLFFMPNVIYCDAVHGAYDLALLLNAATQPELEALVETRLRSLPEIAEVSLSRIVPPRVDPVIAEFMRDYDQQTPVDPATRKVSHARTSLTTYLFVEIAPDRVNEVFPKLYFLQGVVSCDAVQGGCDAVVLVQSSSFEGTRKILEEELSLIDGIARVRSAKIINLFEM